MGVGQGNKYPNFIFLPPSDLLVGSAFAKPSGKVEEVSNSVHTGQSLERAQIGRTEKEYGMANGQCPYKSKSMMFQRKMSHPL